MRSIARATARASPPSSSACWSATTPCTSAPAPASTPPPRSGWPRSPSGSRRSAPTFSQNVLADEQDYTLVARRARTTSPACRTSCARRRARRRPSAAWPASTSSRCRAPASSRSCNSPRAATCARRRSAPGSRAATTAARPTTRRSIAEMVALRAERAKLLGYRDLRPLPARRRHGEDAGRGARPARSGLGAGARAARSPTATPCRSWCAQEGGNFKIAPWDWRYYAEKLRKVRCDIDEATVKPYFQLHHIIEAAFYTAYKLFGLTFERRKDVADLASRRDGVGGDAAPDGRHVGLFFGDYFARPSKRSRRLDDDAARPGEAHRADIRPLVVNVMNFNKGGDGEPTLLSFDDARTLFHEFGHALHGLLSDVTYPMVAGTSVLTDWVELPSQLYEHWLEQPEILRRFAIHCPTGRADPGRPAQAAARRAQLQPRLRHGRVRRLRAGRSRRCICCKDADGFDVDAFEDDALDKHRHAGGDRDAAPAAAFPACVLRRRLCLGLLQLHVVGGARRRRVRAPSRRPATSSIRRRRRSCTTTSIPPAAGAIRKRSTPRSAAGCRADALLARRGLVRRGAGRGGVALSSWSGFSRPSTSLLLPLLKREPAIERRHDGSDGPPHRRTSPRRRLRAACRRGRGRPRRPRRRRQCARSDGRDGGVDRGRSIRT